MPQDTQVEQDSPTNAPYVVACDNDGVGRPIQLVKFTQSSDNQRNPIFADKYGLQVQPITIISAIHTELNQVAATQVALPNESFRKKWFIQNDPTSDDDLHISIDSDPNVGAWLITLQPGESISEDRIAELAVYLAWNNNGPGKANITAYNN